jgi:hypothetical protein
VRSAPYADLIDLSSVNHTQILIGPRRQLRQGPVMRDKPLDIIPLSRLAFVELCGDFSLLWVFHHALRTGCVEFLLVDASVIVGIDLRKVHDVRSGVCLR